MDNGDVDVKRDQKGYRDGLRARFEKKNIASEEEI